ncbi:hypothetical protein Y032_0134g1847 [Ancylostoma ceylanicum]|uniref:Uncharacterized protein n=1 Tax=Ancylostoma ceylanicum TaxID=53326 RepID=A0A016T5Z6_9BILA|nr:hypothetical protein Y032_0134g1847 [Ancylostoma ceylanicum]
MGIKSLSACYTTTLTSLTVAKDRNERNHEAVGERYSLVGELNVIHRLSVMCGCRVSSRVPSGPKFRSRGHSENTGIRARILRV